MKKKTIFILLIILLVISTIFFVLYQYNVKKDEIIVEEPFLMKLSNQELDEYKRRAINDGDMGAYDEFSAYYSLNLKHDELFFYSFLMANKHNDPSAFFDLYILLTIPLEENGIEMFSMDEITQNFAFYFLLKSYELGNRNAKYAVEQKFENSKEIPNSSYYLNEIARDTASLQ